jgi:peptidyl-prolyl cis-trans isomerase D
MISWIQKYFQKHFRLVFGLILVAMAVPLVVIYSQSSGLGRADRQVAEQLFFGRNLANEQEYARIRLDGSYSAQFRGAYQMDNSQLDEYALERVAALGVADRLHLPVPTESEIAAYIASLPVFKDQQGNFDQKRYADFQDSLKTNPRFGIAEARRVLEDDTRIKTVEQLLGGPGYVLPGDVRESLGRSDAKWTISVATLDYASFDPGLKVSEDALKKYFEENSFRYEVPARPKLKAVEFKSAEFVSNEPVSEEQLRAYYAANQSRFPAPAEPAKDPKVPPAPVTDSFTKVRAQVEIFYRLEIAARAAVQAANDFAVALYESKATPNSPELAAFLAGKNRTAVDIPPFTPDNPPPGMPWLANQEESISRLNKDHFFSDVLAAPTGAYVLLWTDTLPDYKPLLSEVHDKVAADFKENEKLKAFVARGQVLRSQLEAALKAGTPFEKAAAAEKLDVKSYPGFMAKDAPKDLPPSALEALSTLQAGQVGDMIRSESGDKGYLVYVAQKQLPEFSPSNPRFTEVRSRLMNYNSFAGGRTALAELVKAEQAKTAPATSAR